MMSEVIDLKKENFFSKRALRNIKPEAPSKGKHMPCDDTTSIIQIDIKGDCLKSFDFSKMACGKDISVKEKYLGFCAGKKLLDICHIPFLPTLKNLEIEDEEEQFLFHLQWDALRCAITQYLGWEIEDIDRGRCQIACIDHNEENTIISMLLLPPKDFPDMKKQGHIPKEDVSRKAN